MWMILKCFYSGYEIERKESPPFKLNYMDLYIEQSLNGDKKVGLHTPEWIDYNGRLIPVM